jgi:predicted adenine nucleotide alpha hydrolase (AANH) superfamily ATPase
LANKINYQKKLDVLIDDLKRGEKVPRLFLHSCCAPCSSYVLEYLSEYFSILLFYYNPNIAPEEEYHMRVREQKRLVESLPVKHKVTFLEGEYRPETFYQAVRGLEGEPEGGKRCFVCYQLRMEEAARLAAAHGCDYFATTLSISPLKNAEKINEIGEALDARYGVRHLPSDFKKKNGYQRSIQLSREYELYRQNYCGCVFSRRNDEI